MRLYTDNGVYVVWDTTNDYKKYFDTESEAIKFMNNLELAKAIVYRVQQLIQTMDNGPDVVQEYFDAGVTFTDEDVESLGITANDVINCITLLQQFAKFVGNEAITQALYRSTLNKVRRVDAS